MLIGGLDDNDQPLAAVLLLAVDGSGWSDLPPLMTARAFAAAALLPDGKRRQTLSESVWRRGQSDTWSKKPNKVSEFCVNL